MLMALMRYLRRLLNRWFGERNRRDETPWTRETPWRQGSFVPREAAISLALMDDADSAKKLAIVVSHDCDLANEISEEPNVEIIVADRIPACLSDKTYAKNVRILHIDIEGPGGRSALELVARNKVSIPKSQLASFGPDAAYSIGKPELDTVRSWLAARYKRASIPDGLQVLVKDIFEDVAKKRDRPRALRGIWIDFEPDADHLEAGDKYELWVVVVYSSSDGGAKSVAEETAKQIERKFKNKYWKDGKWAGLELRECTVRSDTEFTLYDTLRYKLFRLEYLSIKAGTPVEMGNG